MYGKLSTSDQKRKALDKLRKEPSFKQKLKGEEKRVKELPSNHYK